MNPTISKILFSAIAIIFIIIRRVCPQLQIDSIDLILLVLLLLPWFSGLIKGMELPGGFKIDFQELKSAGDKIIGDSITKKKVVVKSKVFIPQDNNSNLALVSLRIEIEKRLQKLISIYKLTSNNNIPSLLNVLKANGIFNESELDGLRNIIIAGNRAAHGVKVDSQAMEWANEEGSKILNVLDAKIQQMSAA